MATPEENVAAAAPAPATEPPAEEALAAAGVESKTREVETAKEVKKEEKGGAQDLKSTLLISGAVVAVVGAVLAIVKKAGYKQLNEMICSSFLLNRQVANSSCRQLTSS